MKVAPLGPVSGAYYLSNAPTSIIVGPVGSGKSTASCLRLARHAFEQHPGPDGIAHTRWAIVRNTKPQLKDTTIKTWLQVFPEAQYGDFLRGDNLSHHWRFKPQGWDYPIEAEFLFRALDDASDVSNMLSLELTGFYFNEIREIDQSIIMHAHERAGRYPAISNGGCKWHGFIGDSNAWDTDHYLYPIMIDRVFPSGEPADWELFVQPSGMSPQAENRENLPPGYYERLLAQHSEEDRNVYVHAMWGHTKSGKPIYTEYRDTLHCRPFELSSNLPIDIGLDFGRTPAAAIGQRTPFGGWRVRYELCAFDMGLVAFANELKRFLADKVPGAQIGNITGDPAGNERDARDETAFDILKVAGLQAQPAHTNEFSTRVESVQAVLRRLANGEPAMLIHPDCKMLRRACIDGYHYRKLQIAGNRYATEPNKNEYSHIAEALQYLLLGGGEARTLTKRRVSESRPRYAIT